MMKKETYFISILLLLSLLGCSPDEKETKNENLKEVKKEVQNEFVVYEGTKHYERDLNEVFDILMLAHNEEKERFNQELKAYEKRKRQARISPDNYEEQEEFDEQDVFPLIPLQFPILDSTQKEVSWAVLEDLPNGQVDTLVMVRNNFHFIRSKIGYREVSLLRKVDYYAKYSMKNNTIGFYSFYVWHFLYDNVSMSSHIWFYMSLRKGGFNNIISSTLLSYLYNEAYDHHDFRYLTMGHNYLDKNDFKRFYGVKNNVRIETVNAENGFKTKLWE